MTHTLDERSICCPYCGQSIDILLDTSAGGQDYIEDCQVCCQPIQISFSVSQDELDYVSVERAD